MPNSAEARKAVPQGEADKPYAITPDTAKGKMVSGEIITKSSRPELRILEGGKGKEEISVTEAGIEKPAVAQLEVQRQGFKKERVDILGRVKRGFDSMKGLLRSLAEAKVVESKTAETFAKQVEELEDLTEFAMEISEEQGQVEGAIATTGGDEEFNDLLGTRMQEMQADAKKAQGQEALLNQLRQAVAPVRAAREQRAGEAEMRAIAEHSPERYRSDAIANAIDPELAGWFKDDANFDASEETEAKRQASIAGGDVFASPKAEAEAKVRREEAQKVRDTEELRIAKRDLENNRKELPELEAKRKKLLQDEESMFRDVFKIKDFDINALAQDENQAEREEFAKKLAKELSGFGKRAERRVLREWLQDWITNEGDIRIVQGSIEKNQAKIDNLPEARQKSFENAIIFAFRARKAPEKKERLIGMAA